MVSTRKGSVRHGLMLAAAVLALLAHASLAAADNGDENGNGESSPYQDSYGAASASPDLLATSEASSARSGDVETGEISIEAEVSSTALAGGGIAPLLVGAAHASGWQRLEKRVVPDAAGTYLVSVSLSDLEAIAAAEVEQPGLMTSMGLEYAWAEVSVKLFVYEEICDETSCSGQLTSPSPVRLACAPDPGNNCGSGSSLNLSQTVQVSSANGAGIRVILELTADSRVAGAASASVSASAVAAEPVVTLL